jgi:hypothetical protein
VTASVRPPPAEELQDLVLAMSPWAQAKLIRMAREMAKTWPAKRGGHLRLVQVARQVEAVRADGISPLQLR